MEWTGEDLPGVHAGRGHNVAAVTQAAGALGEERLLGERPQRHVGAVSRQVRQQLQPQHARSASFFCFIVRHFRNCTLLSFWILPACFVRSSLSLDFRRSSHRTRQLREHSH